MKTMILALVVFIGSPVHAAMAIKMKQTQFVPTPTNCEMLSFVDAARGRVDADCGSRKITTIIVHKPRELILMDTDKKSYYSLGDKQLEALTKGPLEAMKSDPRMAERLKKMTPEQRGMMMRMMGGAGEGKKAVLKATSKTKTIAGHACTISEIRLDGKLYEELCLADWKQFPEVSSMLPVWREFSKSMAHLSHSPAVAAQDEASIQGLAMETVKYDGEKITMKMEVVSVGNETKPDAFFQVPGDYKKSTVPFGM